MADSTRLIKKYYHTIKSVNLSSIINQVDTVAALAASIINSDFNIILYKKKGNENLIPVAYHNNTDISNPDIQKLEEIWCHSDVKKSSIPEGTMCLESGLESDYKNDAFARQYDFKYISHHPYYDDGDLQILIVSYWYGAPEYDEKRIEQSYQHLYKIIHSLMNSIYENKIINDYTIRLSDLIALFEIPLEDYSFKDMLHKLFKKLQQIVPGGYLLLTIDEKNEGFILDTSSNIDIPSSSFMTHMSRELAEFTEELQGMDTKSGICVDFSKKFQDYFAVVLACPLYLSKSKNSFILSLSDNTISLTQNDKQLMSLFSLFASIILRVSAMLEQEKKVNKLLKKSSSQMADVETLAALTDMTSGVAHDFNNMIGGIIGRVQLLKLKVHDEKLFEKLDKIEQLAQNGAETVKRIQEFTSGAKYKELEPLDIVDVVNDYFENDHIKWNEEALSKGVSVVKQVDIESGIIDGSHADLLIALDKLIENAVEHSSDKSEVFITVTENNGDCILRVHNKGSVIKESDYKKIFYPFFTTKHEYGAGMGLAIVHGIITRHGGKIHVDSSADDGTMFIIRLPKSDALKEESDISRRKKTTAELRILVVDDDEQIREVLTDMLTIDGYIITPCEDGPSALKAFEEGDFEMMITDLGMPGMSGLELAGLVHEQKPEIPIAMITGWGTQLNQDEVALKGIKSVVSKPFHLKDIKALIRELVEQA